ncbi:hypothetical protein BKA82DRAFT_145457 [Pisolithus tinctorius]|uniref:Uncharacterized protein n=1 Tax=Pisolithus tinctorius Marx 270 TaxID=870435 RepID=A0A0C3P7Z8_PISTI|nr:hypothetical protein BKA82DRAFT_145457 [Pisolithus tinctorius]KIO03594.1 hypothetical protein M404DRAFT_145457 [Pisolithus tinctorius Marx 270]
MSHPNSQNVWELQCPKGCWVKTGICTHIPLQSNGQFTTLQCHWATSNCNKVTVTSVCNNTLKSLSTLFPKLPTPALPSMQPSHLVVYLHGTWKAEKSKVGILWWQVLLMQVVDELHRSR